MAERKAKAEDKNKKLEKENETLKAEMKRLEDKNQKTEDEKRKIEDEKTKLETEKMKLEERQHDVDAEKKKIEKDKIDTEEEMSKLEKENARLEEEKNKLEAESKILLAAERKKTEDERTKTETAAKTLEAEKKRLEIEKKAIEMATKTLEEEKKRFEAERKKKTEDEKSESETKRLEDEKHKAELEAKKKLEEEEKRRLEEEKQKNENKKAKAETKRDPTEQDVYEQKLQTLGLMVNRVRGEPKNYSSSSDMVDLAVLQAPLPNTSKALLEQFVAARQAVITIDRLSNSMQRSVATKRKHIHHLLTKFIATLYAARETFAQRLHELVADTKTKTDIVSAILRFAHYYFMLSNSATDPAAEQLARFIHENVTITKTFGYLTRHFIYVQALIAMIFAATRINNLPHPEVFGALVSELIERIVPKDRAPNEFGLTTAGQFYDTTYDGSTIDRLNDPENAYISDLLFDSNKAAEWREKIRIIVGMRDALND